MFPFLSGEAVSPDSFLYFCDIRSFDMRTFKCILKAFALTLILTAPFASLEAASKKPQEKKTLRTPGSHYFPGIREGCFRRMFLCLLRESRTDRS